jgi:hypothetical protein
MRGLLEKFACFGIARTETFGNPMQGMEVAGAAISALVVLLILCLFGQYLWNHALCPLVSVVRPAKSVFQILGVAILLSLLLP